jgi:hypothetical protein
MGSLNSSKTYRVFGSLHLNLSDKILVHLQWGVWTLLGFVHSESLCDHQVWGDGLVIYQEAPCKPKVGNWASQRSLDLEALLSLPTVLPVVWVIGLHTFLLLLFCYTFFHCCLILWNLMLFELSSKWLDRSKGQGSIVLHKPLKHLEKFPSVFGEHLVCVNIPPRNVEGCHCLLISVRLGVRSLSLKE